MSGGFVAQPPRELGGYRLEGLLGRGGMGAVYAATHLASGAPAALKLTQLREPRQRARFLREQQVLERAQVTGVVRILGSGEAGPYQFVAMERLRGQTLEQRLEEGPLPPAEARALAGELAGTLAACHARGILHRDLKPANVFLTAAGPKLIDFGLGFDAGLAESRLTQTGAFLGTPGFWAPEQASGRTGETGAGVDVYGLGAVLYACLTQAPPHAGKTLQELMGAVSRQPPPPSSLNPAVPRALDRVCARCLAPDPRERYGSMQALCDDLRTPRALAGAGPRAGRGWWLGLGALGVVALGLGGVVWALGDAPPTADEVDVDGPGIAPPEVEQEEVEQEEVEQEVAPPEVEQEDVERLIEEAQRLARAGELEGALARVDRALETNAAHPPSWSARGAVLSLLDRREEAVHAMRRAAELEPRDGALQVNFIMALEAQRQFRDALQACDRALEANPELGAIYARRAALHSLFGDHAEALADATRALELEGESHQLLRSRGLALVKLKRYAEALRDADRALQLEPGGASALGLRAEALLALERNTEAIDACSAALRAGAGLSREWALQVQAMRGQALFRLGRFREAVADFDPFLQQFPDSSLYRRLRGVSHFNLRRLKEGAADLERCIQLDPDDLEARLRLAAAYAYLDRAQEALQLCDSVLAREPDSPGAYATKAVAYAALDRYDDAAAAYGEAIRVAPDVADFYAQRARCRIELGRHADAVVDFDRTLELGIPGGREAAVREERAEAARRAAE